MGVLFNFNYATCRWITLFIKTKVNTKEMQTLGNVKHMHMSNCNNKYVFVSARVCVQFIIQMYRCKQYTYTYTYIFVNINEYVCVVVVHLENYTRKFKLKTISCAVPSYFVILAIFCFLFFICIKKKNGNSVVFGQKPQEN